MSKIESYFPCEFFVEVLSDLFSLHSRDYCFIKHSTVTLTAGLKELKKKNAKDEITYCKGFKWFWMKEIRTNYIRQT